MRKQGAPIKHLARGIPGLLVKASHPVFARRLEAAARAFAEGGATGEHFTDLSDACMAVMIALELKGRKKLPAPVEAGAECLRTIHRRHEAGGPWRHPRMKAMCWKRWLAPWWITGAGKPRCFGSKRTSNWQKSGSNNWRI